MQILTGKSSRFLGVLLSSVFLLACEKNISINEAKIWFSENESLLVSINKKLIKNKKIERIDTGLRMKFMPNVENFDEKDVNLYENIASDFSKLGVKSVAVLRVDDLYENQLVAISYVLSSSGVPALGGGKSLVIKYITDSDFLAKLASPERVVKSLNEKNWYVVEYGI